MTAIGAAPLDLTMAREYAGDDEELLRELLTILIEDGPVQLDALREAVTTMVPAAIMRAAHTMKGALRPIGAHEAAALAERLEAMGRGGHIAGCASVLAVLERELTSVWHAAAAALETEPK